MKNMKNIIMVIALIVVFTGCSSDSSNEDGGIIEEIIAPEAAILRTPLNNSECNIGVYISDTESTIKFDWIKGKGADSYDVVLKNLSDNSSRILNTDKTELNINLKQGTSYSWSVISKSKKTNKTSETVAWEMFNASKPTQNYAPYPADIISPVIGASVSGNDIDLEWKGSDKDGDITSYEIYLGVNNPPVALIGSTLTNKESINSGSLSSGTTYYWYVTTKDAYGNKTKSTLTSFDTSN